MKVTDFSDLSYYEKICIFNKEDLLRNIKRIERVVRNSLEYKAYIRCTRETDDIKGCSFFVDKELEDCTLQIHHIINLFTLCEIVGFKLLDSLNSDEVLSVFDVAQGVLYLHYKDLIPVISLTQTVHELYHSGQYSLPKSSKQLHLGNYKDFIKEYKDYLDLNTIRDVYEYFDDIDNTEFDSFLKEIQK